MGEIIWKMGAENFKETDRKNTNTAVTKPQQTKFSHCHDVMQFNESQALSWIMKVDGCSEVNTLVWAIRLKQFISDVFKQLKKNLIFNLIF